MIQQLLAQLTVRHLKKLVYPAISILFVSVALLLFGKTAFFISANINKAFTTDEAAIESELLRVDIQNYLLVAKKLNIPVPPPPTPQEIPPPQETSPEETPTPPPPPPEDKAALHIQVVNSTPTAGLAGGLRDLLEGAEFTVVRVGNFSPPHALTVIQIKESTRSSFPLSLEEIRGLVSQEYELGGDETLEESSEYDVVIIIGNK